MLDRILGPENTTVHKKKALPSENFHLNRRRDGEQLDTYTYDRLLGSGKCCGDK